MCGIVGFWQPHGSSYELAACVQAMANRIVHRGPDGNGHWVDEVSGVALGHRRLAVIDLTQEGHQPMHSASGRYVAVYNGEIYNHLQLRRDLELNGQAPPWRGHSDTETLLACIEAWGVEATLKRSVGMFAFGLWDRALGRLILARDRLGEKPLYYGWQGQTLLFGSELKALATHPEFRHEIDRSSIALLLRHNYVPAPFSIWQGINKLPAGTWMEIRERCLPGDPIPYWSLTDVALAGTATPLAMPDDEARDALDDVLRQAIGGQMVSDVPIGALLSGGVDSSTVVALMQAQSARPVRTYCIGFHHKGFDESTYAEEVARHLRTDHTTLHMTPADALEAVPRISRYYDEPLGDSSQLATSLVMALARKNVTVALSGDGGDELFGGYESYIRQPKQARLIARMPNLGLRSISRLFLSISPATWDKWFALAGKLHGQRLIGDKLHKIGQRLKEVRTKDDFYIAMLNEWGNAEQLVCGADRRLTLLSSPRDWPPLADSASRMMALDALTYLPDDILVKVDRAAMAASLETRAPFLDHRVAEFAWRLPMNQKIRFGKGKWLLRQVLYKYVPRELIDRPKRGFGIPLDDWLRGPLREWAEELLSVRALQANGLNTEIIRTTWAQHLSGSSNYGHRLWSILMFQSWCADQSAFRDLTQ